MERKVLVINRVVEKFFNQNPTMDICKPKDLMPLLIEEGLFKKDCQYGLPLRKILRKLDDVGLIDNLIPSIMIIRKPKNRFWFFINPYK